MASIIFLSLLFASTFAHLLSATTQPANPISRITVFGVVFCDTCSSNTFSRHSYFLSGVDVNIKCKFRANSPKTSEQMVVSVNKTTDQYGVYKLEIPHVNGVDCVEGLAIESICYASLIGTSSSPCNVPALKTSTNQISVKAKQENLCIYSLNALSYKPSKRNVTLCGNNKEKLPNSLETSKCFLPFFPPYGFSWPLHSFTFPSLPPHPPLLSRPFTYTYNPPSLPSPFPPTPSIFKPPPPREFNLGDPKTWIPSFPPPPPSSSEDLKP